EYRVTELSIFVNKWPSGIGKSKDFCTFIKGFSHSIIGCFSDNFHFEIISHFDDLGMTSTNGHRQKRKFWFVKTFFINKMSQNMALHVIDSNKRNIGSFAKSLSLSLDIPIIRYKLWP